LAAAVGTDADAGSAADMTKLSIADGQDAPERFVGILKYYVAFGLIGLLVVGGFAYWAMGVIH
jgi:hypothetical protein